ncbi:MAG TPA: universal stress protein, partial [Acidimicrobiales bacterium]
QAWQMQSMAASPWGPMPPDLGDLEAIAQESLDEALRDPALEGVDAVGHITNSGATRALVEQAEGAGLVVVGSRGLGRIGSALLGSVTRQLLHHAPCPVVVI